MKRHVAIARAVTVRVGQVAVALAATTGTAEVAAQERPSLVVLLTVDQLRPDYLDRFAPDLTGGFARLARDGAFFTEAWHDHAMTWTAPGHATLWSGRFPAHNGIVSNALGVPDPAHPLIGGALGPGASPARFHGTALYDWLRAAEPDARMLAVSRKDGGAILSVGSARVPTFWWATQGMFTTSTYYTDTLPTWVAHWNERVARADWRDRVWSLALPEAAYPEPDDLTWEGVGAGRPSTFPHRMESIRRLANFPWMDSLTLDLALTGARELALGRSAPPDLLAVGLSTLDVVGHHFGPDSREVHDHFVRLDRWLGAFMAELERDLGDGSVLYVLSSDHGITSMPEALNARGVSRAGHIDLAASLRRIAGPTMERRPDAFGIRLQGGLVLADTAALRAAGIGVRELATEIARGFADLPGVDRTFTPWTLAVTPEADQAAGQWRRTIPPSYGWIALAEPEEGWVLGTNLGAQHGTPLRENMIVPVFFLGAGIPSARIDRPIRTVDVAPTVAALLGVSPTEPVDGVPLIELSSGR